MGTSDNLDKWGEQNRDVGLLLVRLVLGAVLILKGYRFLFHTNDIINMINTYHQSSLTIYFAWLVILANLVGGIFILIGILPRVTAIIEIPILIGAMLLNLEANVLNSSEWLLAFVTFFLIVYLYIFGSGKYSVGYLLLRAPQDEEEEEKEERKRSSVVSEPKHR
jgi:putative oxidoreductase